MSKRKAASIMDGMQELHVSPRDKKVKRVSSKEKGELIIAHPSVSLFARWKLAIKLAANPRRNLV